jgi:hypothetical protein
LALVALVLVLPSTGCIGGTATFLYWLRGLKVDAEYVGLKGKRVAVICVCDSSTYGLDTTTESLARFLEATLRKHVDDIELVRQDEVRDWIDNNDWDQIDFTQIGRGVDAERVLAVELSSYSLNNGRTLFQGRANVTVSVYDITDDGKLDFVKRIPEYEFPRNGGQPVTDTSRVRFEQKFLHTLSQEIANYFYDYEMVNNYANDSTVIGQ